MNVYSDNSFFYENYSGLKILVFVPHEDDEILTAGSLLYLLSRAGAEIYIVYATNGDFKYKAATRIDEAVKAASVLGVQDDHIIFMGYGDSGPADESGHIFYHEYDSIKSLAGFTSTYGSGKYQDFSYFTHGAHNTYTANHYINDIIEIFSHIKPNLVICSDFDEHPDHKMLSTTFDKAIGLIKHKYPDYSPEIWKTFAYSFYYSADPDFTVLNNVETKRPVLGTTNKYSYEIIDRFNYCWNDRVRIPNPLEQRVEKLSENIISKALKKHKSQRIITKADRIINSDEIFFRRRTDNKAFCANVRVSSGDPKHLSDFMLYNVNSIDPVSFSLSNYYWQPEEQDSNKSIHYEWETPISIEKIVIFGTYSKDSYIAELSIKLSDGYEVNTEELPSTGSPISIFTGSHENIKWCNITVLSYFGKDYGISECEIYSCRDYTSMIKPFCKITIDDNFVYDYICSEDITSIKLGLYRFNIADEISVKVIKGKSRIIDNVLYINNEDHVIIIRACDKSGFIFDQISINRFSDAEITRYKKFDIVNKKFIQSEKKKLKLHNALYILIHSGLISVVKRTWRNVVKPRLKRIKK